MVWLVAHTQLSWVRVCVWGRRGWGVHSVGGGGGVGVGWGGGKCMCVCVCDQDTEDEVTLVTEVDTISCCIYVQYDEETQ